MDPSDSGIASALADAAARLLGRALQPVAVLSGGEHARTCVVADGREDLVVRRFPPGDPAVRHEVEVLARVEHLAPLVPRLVAADPDGGDEGPMIVTSRLPGCHPGPRLAPTALARGLAQVLARIHASGGEGLRDAEVSAPETSGPLAAAARALVGSRPGGGSDAVLTHYDFWCGNTLWIDDRPTGVVDWSGARRAPRGQDVAWCRLDLVLLHGVEAAEAFLAAYEEAADVTVDDVADWDLLAAAHAEDAVEGWAPNYAGIGRPELTPEALRGRLVGWGEVVLEARTPR
ncbi:hypothetical protein GCM10027425_27800 [Alteromonas gracilis]